MADLQQLDACKNLQIQGLMSIPPLGLETGEIAKFFEQTAQLADKIRQQNWSHIQMRHLSMGMSDDYQLAVTAGATMVRKGRILFAEGSEETGLRAPLVALGKPKWYKLKLLPRSAWIRGSMT